MTSNIRDPHLPSPEVCDWLLNQEWSDVAGGIDIKYSEAGRFGIRASHICGNWVYAFLAIGADETGRIFMPSEALELLRDDKQARIAAFEEKRSSLQADEEQRKQKRDAS